MKYHYIALAIGLFAFATASQASIVAYDGFGYNTGELNGQNGGVGWGSAWSANIGVTQIVDPGVDLIDDRALQFTGNNDNAAYRALATTFTGNQLFVDFYLQIDSGSLVSNDFLALWLDTITSGSHTSRPNFGIKADGSGNNDVFGRTTGTGGSFVPNSNIGSSNDVTYHLVGLLSKSSGVNYDKLAIWLNPVFGDLSTPDALYNGSSTITQITKVGFRSANLDNGDVVLVDNLRLSTTWNDVMNVPEPTTLALLGIGLAGIGFRTRK